MKLYLLRHADAETSAVTDAKRALTEKGLEQAERVGKFCRENEIVPDVIVTSPYLRASQTAEIVGRILDVPTSVSAMLGCGMSPDSALTELRSLDKFDAVMLVGHEPDFSQFLAFLVGARSGECFHLRKASLTAVRLPMLRRGEGVIEFSIQVRLM